MMLNPPQGIIDLTARKKIDDAWVSVVDFGAMGDDVTDDTAAFNQAFAAGKRVYIPTPAVAYKLSKFQGVAGQQVIGGDSCLIHLYSVGGGTVLVGLESNSTYDNIQFVSTETDLEWNRTDVSSKENVVIRRCKFEGFRNPTNSNSWGLYLSSSKNIVIEQCTFENNTQADIAILEGCENIQVINATGSNLTLNFEPNPSSYAIKNVNVVGGNYAIIYLLENSGTVYSIQNIKIDSCTINNVFLNGANVDFVNCKILNFSNFSNTLIMGSAAELNNSISLGQNLIKDPNLVSLSKDHASSNWILRYNTIVTEFYTRITDTTYGRLTRLNPAASTGVISIKNNVDLLVSDAKKYLLAVTSRAIYNAASSSIGRQCMVEFYQGTTYLSAITTCINRAGVSSTTALNTEVAVISPPAGTTKLVITLQNAETDSSSMVDILAVSLHEIKFVTSYEKGNTSDLAIIHKTIPAGTKLVGDAAAMPTGETNGYINYEAGDEINISPVSGSNYKYIYTATGWKGTGTLQ
jgi:hypothetical protein